MKSHTSDSFKSSVKIYLLMSYIYCIRKLYRLGHRPLLASTTRLGAMMTSSLRMSLEVCLVCIDEHFLSFFYFLAFPDFLTEAQTRSNMHPKTKHPWPPNRYQVYSKRQMMSRQVHRVQSHSITRCWRASGSCTL